MSFDTNDLNVNTEDKVETSSSQWSPESKEVLTQAWTGLMNELHRLVQEKFSVSLTQHTTSQ